jgi:hypothetical protein
MASIYKYLTEETHARALIERGEIRFRLLAAFRALEGDGVRGDTHDGKLQYAPGSTLPLTKENGEVVELPGYRFTSSVRAEDIFAYCMSRAKTKELASEFASPFCVEIKDPIRLISRIRSSVRLRSKLDRKHIYHGPIDYRSRDTAPGVDWALPERMALVKPESFARQDEYRIVIGKKGAFAVENVDLNLETGNGGKGETTEYDPLTLKVGDLAQICELHRF